MKIILYLILGCFLLSSCSKINVIEHSTFGLKYYSITDGIKSYTYFSSDCLYPKETLEAVKKDIDNRKIIWHEFGNGWYRPRVLKEECDKQIKLHQK